MKYSYFFSLIAIVLSLIACTATRNTSPINTTTPSVTTAEDKEEESHSSPQIIFMNFELSKQENGGIKANLVNTIITEGKIKDKQYGREMKKGDIVCKGLNKDNKVIQSLSYDNPMLKTVEYVNDEGQLEKKQISLDQVQFTVRMQLNPNTKSIALEQINPTGSISLITFKIEQK